MIDQQHRRRLCARILDADRQAVHELARLYRAEGYATLAESLERALESGRWDGLMGHARAVLGSAD